MFISSLFFSTHPPTDDIYTLSLHDALPISHDNDVSFECLIIECGIFLNRQSESRFYGNKHQHKIEALEAVNLLIVLARQGADMIPERSEERRVGKECRAWIARRYERTRELSTN